jgi:hypothetical protein
MDVPVDLSRVLFVCTGIDPNYPDRQDSHANLPI